MRVQRGFAFRPYEAGGARFPKKRRILKKILREWARYGWKSARWFEECYHAICRSHPRWQPSGPYQPSGPSGVWAARGRPRSIAAARSAWVSALLAEAAGLGHAPTRNGYYCSGCFTLRELTEDGAPRYVQFWQRLGLLQSCTRHRRPPPVG